MKKVIALWGSPRKDGYTAELMKCVIEGVKSTGAEVISYNGNDEEIRGCQGCNYCRIHEGCATNDKLSSMYKEIKEADGVIASFPIYFGNIGGQSKQLLDRLYPMLDQTFNPRYPGKKVVTLYAQDNEDKDFCKQAIETNNMFFKMFGWTFVDSILWYGNANSKEKMSKEVLKRAFEAGKKLV